MVRLETLVSYLKMLLYIYEKGEIEVKELEDLAFINLKYQTIKNALDKWVHSGFLNIRTLKKPELLLGGPRFKYSIGIPGRHEIQALRDLLVKSTTTKDP